MKLLMLVRFVLALPFLAIGSLFVMLGSWIMGSSKDGAWVDEWADNP